MSARFVTDSDLNAALERIFLQAEEQLLLISPYIKLHDRLQSILKTKVDEDKLFIQIVFGKNEEDPARSMKKSELEFFMQFPNIEIRHERRLHAKYYTNDTEALITSMNLYSYSQDNNIESGILTSVSGLAAMAGQLTRKESLDEQALHYFDRVAGQADPIFKKEPTYEKVMFGLTKKYLGSKVTVDNVDAFFSKRSSTSRVQTPTRPPSIVATTPEPAQNKAHGYCIRTGAPIPFSVKRPLSDEAYKSWSRYKDETYREKYCHFTGEGSNGDTSVSRPILRKNWNEAKAVHKF